MVKGSSFVGGNMAKKFSTAQFIQVSRSCTESVKICRLGGKEVNITTEGKRHARAVIGSKDYKDDYCTDKV